MAQKPIEVFFSYSREDKALRDKLEIHLSGLKRQGVISSWHDRQLLAGDEWKREIDQHIQTADVILLLISPNFIASEYCYDIELPDAMARHDAGEACVVPILMRPVSGWQDFSFAKLQVYPSGGKPVTKWLDEDDAFVDVTDGIRAAVKQLLSNPHYHEQKQQRLNQVHLQAEQAKQKAEAEEKLRLSRQPFTIYLPDRTPLEMLAIPGGKFQMGSPDGEGNDNERPRHEVTIAPFFMSKFPITQAQYQALMGKNPSSFEGEKRPVETVSWHDAIAFCEKLSSQEKRKFTLPSESQWEYACRAGTETPFYFGETISTEQANYDGNFVYGSGKEGTYRKQTTDVGSFPPNKFGLYDMHGNVWEWCEDHWHNRYEGAPTDGSAWIDPKAAQDDPRVLRGGSWIFDPRLCRSATRDGNDAGDRGNSSGFRVLCLAPRT
jgi:formylglycine-generating enzyme required for sulfatase activity